MPKKGGKGKGKKKEPDWGEIVREQYVTIEVRDDHAATAAARCVIFQMQCLTRSQMRNSKWHSMCFKHTMAVSEPVPA